MAVRKRVCGETTTSSGAEATTVALQPSLVHASGQVRNGGGKNVLTVDGFLVLALFPAP